MSLTPPEGPRFLRARLPVKVWAPILLVAVALIAAAAVYLAPTDDTQTAAAGDQELSELGDAGAAEVRECKRDGNPGNPTVFEDPSEFLGNPIHFFVKVGEVVDPYSVRVLSPDACELDLLVVYNGNPPVEAGDLVEVEGTIEAFTPATVGEVLGSPVPASTFEASSDEIALIAHTLIPSKQPKEKDKAPVELAIGAPASAPVGSTTVTSDAGSSVPAPVSAGESSTTAAPPPSSEPAPSGSSGGGSGGTGGSGGGSGGGSSGGSGGGGGSGGSPAVTFTSGSASSGQYSDQVTLSARLVDGRGDAIEGAKLTFSLQDAGSFSAQTDGNGVATASPTLTAEPGSYDLAVSYDGARGTASDQTAFEVTREDSALELTTDDEGEDDEGEGEGKNDEGKGESTLIAELVDADSSAAIAERTVEFFADGEMIGTATTDGNGVATFEVPGRYKNGDDFEARFTVDEFFLTSEDSV
ncbi:MAG TPA: Ig-like domain-containing protein [Actinomycetota bacterium]|nr:Ig-like domain-containing protein [Actinomycetota bacterium]